MTRVNFWIGSLLAVALSAVVATQNLAVAQTSSGTSGEAKQETKETKQEAKQSESSQSQPSQSGSTTTSGSAQAGAPSNQSTTSGNASTGNASSNQPQGQTQSNQQTSAGPSNQNQSAASGQQNRENQARDNQPQSRDNQNRGNQTGDNQNRNNQNRGDNQRNNANVNIGVGIQFGAINDRGIAVTTVQPNSFFYTSGIRQGDVIISVGGRPLRSHDEFVQYVSVRRGERIPVIVYRGNREETIYVVYEEPAANMQVNVGNQQGAALLGVTFDSQVQNAAVIVSVIPGGAAAQVGIKAGDHIVSINGRKLNGFQNAIQVIGGMRAGEQVEIEFLQLQRTQVVLSAAGNVQTTAAVSGQVGTGQNVQANYPPSGQVQVGVQAQAGQGQANSDKRTPQGDRQNQPSNQNRGLIPRNRN